MKRFLPSLWIGCVAILFCFSQCRGKQKKVVATNQDTVDLFYAKDLHILKDPKGYSCKVITQKKDQRVEDSFRLTLKEHYTGENNDNSTIEIPIPCKRIICLSSTQLTYFFSLDCLDPIVGINSSRHLFHQELNARVKSGVVKKVGKQGNFNLELIASLQPDVIFVSPFKRGGYASLKQLGIPLIPMAAYSEKTPLGRAEWIKFISLFVGKEKEATVQFNHVAKEYNRLSKLTSGIKKRPTVFSGKMRSGVWYVPGGDSFYAHYFKDAGAEYVFKDHYTGARPLDFETVYSKCINADYWRLLLPEAIGYNRQMLKQEDARYQDFKAFKENKVFMCNIRSKPFYEENAMKPHVILADYIHIFHPDLLANHKPSFYEPLPNE